MPKKTRKQKERTALRREQQQVEIVPQTNGGVRYSFFDSSSRLPLNKQQTAHQHALAAYFKKDLTKTFVVSLIILFFIALFWWKLR
jgi:hypothetical protein